MHILWFRRDLRLNDNESVARATAKAALVLPCFIIDPWFYQQPEVGKARVRFLFESMENLEKNLRNCGSQLYLFEGNSVDILQQLTQQLIQLSYKAEQDALGDVGLIGVAVVALATKTISPLPSICQLRASTI